MTCVICNSESYAIKMTLAKDCECNYVICYDCWQQINAQKRNITCFMCRQKEITGGIPNLDFQDCEDRDKKYGQYQCLDCNIKLARKDFIKHCKAAHCHIGCKLFRAECGNFPTCKMKEHFKNCDLCKYTRCEFCYELLSKDHNIVDCLCKNKLTYCIKRQKILRHECENVRTADGSKLFNVKYCGCGLTRQDCDDDDACQILIKVKKMLQNNNVVKEHNRKINALEQQLLEEDPMKKQKIESQTELTSQTAQTSSSSSSVYIPFDPSAQLNISSNNVINLDG